ncbi:MAG: SRPBCC domain-containing protein [Planctomycetes bacterium]|jgi:uncharacterized protein YndB with AHSA1/START domain|nr:SRPBCC domain-containing protein [Planctomycetota bacterium]
MSVKKEPSGRRSVQVEVEVPGTPEQVWQAIASGPGISAWFVPTQLDGRAGGSLALDFGGGMVSSAKIVDWQPPRRFVAEDTSWLQGGPPVATEWSVESRGGGKCIVRVVHSLFASTDQWDDQLGSTENGWPGYFRVLRHYLTHHRGEPSASFVLMAPTTVAPATAWTQFARALGVPAPKLGQALRCAPPGGAAFVGTVQAVDDQKEGQGIMVHLQEPAPGIALANAMNCMGMCMATLQAYFYGPRAAAAAAQQAHWQSWLVALFPPAAESASG